MEIIGKLVQKLPEQTGEGKNGKWVKQFFVIETQEQYPKKACFSLWGDKVDVLKRFNESDMIKVSFGIESREFNERWYTDLRAWRIDAVTSEQNNTAAVSKIPEDVPDFTFTADSDLPF